MRLYPRANQHLAGDAMVENLATEDRVAVKAGVAPSTIREWVNMERHLNGVETPVSRVLGFGAGG